MYSYFCSPPFPNGQLVLHGVRAALVSFVYLQYVCKKYQTSYWTMTAVTMLYEKVKGVFHHRWCPKPLGALFDRIAGLVQKYAARSR